MKLKYAPDKLALVLALVAYLDDVRVVSIEEAAAHFKVEPQDIDKAIRLIAVSGAPSDDGNVYDNDMFDIDWDALDDEQLIVLERTAVIDDAPRISRAESAALIAGLQYLAALPGSANNSVLSGLQRKLAEVGGGTTHFIAEDYGFEEFRAQIAQAIAHQTQIEFDYVRSDGMSDHRVIDPLQLESDGGNWYARGWCHERDAIRAFRLDRMTNLTPTTRPIKSRSANVALSDALFDESSSDFIVTVEVARAAIPLLGDFVRGADIPKTGDPVHLDVRVAHVHGLKRIICAYPMQMRIVSPSSAASIATRWASQALELYDAAHTQAGPSRL